MCVSPSRVCQNSEPLSPSLADQPDLNRGEDEERNWARDMPPSPHPAQLGADPEAHGSRVWPARHLRALLLRLLLLIVSTCVNTLARGFTFPSGAAWKKPPRSEGREAGCCCTVEKILLFPTGWQEGKDSGAVELSSLPSFESQRNREGTEGHSRSEVRGIVAGTSPLCARGSGQQTQCAFGLSPTGPSRARSQAACGPQLVLGAYCLEPAGMRCAANLPVADWREDLPSTSMLH
ncbi:hypothetical protein SKAU_G00266700 [Synaphobranchus kaupii]|uniref:Uncharacterized protein n=1 Tax=Synaphobranchus kaupii TaxID=118154 RepID=A0A9Q1EZK4_SYNKA|nr:hypothetical protein SKAU_G00266700 [Synaphobranchus kaupii]